jgi:uncharacterized protein YdeI (YjbR/CyaY-like superfamily)
MDITTTTYAAGPAEWRAWLAEHHATETEIWLVYYKKQSGKPSVIYKQALEEALCFGWIDGQIKKIDEERYAQRFTPRRAGSNWSEVNKHLVARLVREGRMTPAGMAKVNFALPEADAPAPPRPDLPLPDWLEAAIKANPRAWENFTALPPSQRQRYTGWIIDAKQEATRRRRLAKALAMLERGERMDIDTRLGDERK